MSFSRAQQGPFRQLVEHAWSVECKQTRRDPLDKAARRFWYEEQLLAACGQRSTSDCNHTRDYEAAMAHFEALAGDSFYWQLRQYSGDRRRILHEVRALAAEFECPEEYMLAIARRALSRENLQPAQLLELGSEQLLTILRALKIQVRRQLLRGDPADHPRHVEEPF
jgi:hypothetical protein